MNLKLAGQIAVVVGGANGMGRKIVDQFAAEGANVALLDRDPVAVEVAQEAAAHGVATLSEQVDVTDFAALQAAATRVEESWGRCGTWSLPSALIRAKEASLSGIWNPPTGCASMR